MFTKEKYLPFIIFDKSKLSEGGKNDQEKDEDLFRQISYTGMLGIVHPYKAVYKISYQSAGTLHLECFLDDNNEWKELQIRRLIFAPIKRKTGYKPQLFRIYRVVRKRTSSGAVVTVDAYHVMYDLNYTLLGQVNCKGNIRALFADLNMYSWWAQGNTPYPGYNHESSLFDEKFFYAISTQGQEDNTFSDLSLSNFRFRNEAGYNDNVSQFSNGGITSFSEFLISGNSSFIAAKKTDPNNEEYDMILDADNFLVNFKAAPKQSEIKFMIRYGKDSADISKTIDSTDTYSYIYCDTNIESIGAVSWATHEYSSLGMPFAQEARMMFSYNRNTKNVSEVFSNDSKESLYSREYASRSYDVKVNSSVSGDIADMAEYDIGDYGIVYDEELEINDTQCIISKEVDLITNSIISVSLGQFPESITRKPSTNLSTSGTSAVEKQISYLTADIGAINSSIEGVL